MQVATGHAYDNSAVEISSPQPLVKALLHTY